MSARVLVLRWLLRAALLLLWTLALWGALLLVLTLVGIVAEGPGPALGRLLPRRGDPVWAWLNALSAALVLGVGVLVGGMLAWGKRARSASSSDEEEE